MVTHGCKKSEFTREVIGEAARPKNNIKLAGRVLEEGGDQNFKSLKERRGE